MTAGLWDYALALYARPGVAAGCLALQDAHGIDVPLMLAAIWAGSRGIPLDAAGIAALRQAVAPWQAQVVHPLRAVRRGLKLGPPPAPDAATEALRQAIAAAELEAERIELRVLEAALAPRPAQADTLRIRENLAALLAGHGLGPDTARAEIAAIAEQAAGM